LISVTPPPRRVVGEDLAGQIDPDFVHGPAALRSAPALP
jgi:hypothetical protein